MMKSVAWRHIAQGLQERVNQSQACLSPESTFSPLTSYLEWVPAVVWGPPPTLHFILTMRL